MLNLIVQLRKQTGISINLCKIFLQKNNWDILSCIKYIEKMKIRNKNNYNYYSIINFINNNKIYVLKIKYNSIIINNSNIIINLINDLKKKIIKKKIIFKILNILSIKLNENVFLSFYFCLVNKNLEFYNHKNLLFCLIKFNSLNFLKKKDLCFQIISKKTKFIKFKNCIFSISNQKSVVTNDKFDNLLINKIEYFFFINKKKIKFIYE